MRRVDILITWFFAPAVVYVAYWFVFWGMRTVTHWHGTVFRAELAAATAILVVVIAAVWLVTIFLADYATYLSSFVWTDWRDYEARYLDKAGRLAGQTDVSENKKIRDVAVATVRMKHIATGILFIVATLGTAIGCWWRFLPLPAGYFFQPAITMVIGLALVFVLRVIFNAHVPFIDNLHGKFKPLGDGGDELGDHRVFSHVVPPMGELRSHGLYHAPTAPSRRW